LGISICRRDQRLDSGQRVDSPHDTGAGIDSREQSTNKINTDELLFDAGTDRVRSGNGRDAVELERWYGHGQVHLDSLG
jgi:hypothetical protein